MKDYISESEIDELIRSGARPLIDERLREDDPLPTGGALGDAAHEVAVEEWRAIGVDVDALAEQADAERVAALGDLADVVREDFVTDAEFLDARQRMHDRRDLRTVLAGGLL